jgi:hypothetical protein
VGRVGWEGEEVGERERKRLLQEQVVSPIKKFIVRGKIINIRGK